MNIKVGRITEIGGREVDLPLNMDLATLCQTHTAVEGITGSGKSSLLMLLAELKHSPEIVNKYGSLQHVIVDEMGVMLNLAKFLGNYKIISQKTASKYFNVENAFNLGKELRRMQISAIIDPSSIDDESQKRKIIGNIISGMRHVEPAYQHLCFVDVDEVDVYCDARRKCAPSKDAIIDAAKRGRNTNLILTLSTQRISSIDIGARSQCVNLIFGKANEIDDCDRASKMMCGSKKLSDRFRMLGKGQFFVRGDVFHSSLGFNYGLVQFDEPDVDLVTKGTEQETLQQFNDIDIPHVDSTGKDISDDEIYNMLTKK